MRNLLWAVPIAIFFLNPNLACTADEPYQYDAAEMRAAVEGNWVLTVTPDGGTPVDVTVQVEQATTAPGATAQADRRRLVRAAQACGARTLVKGAAACADLSVMPLTVTYVSGGPSFADATMKGTFTVYGLVFSTGQLELNVGAYQLLAGVNADGTLVDPHLGPLGSPGSLTVSRP